MAKSDNALWKIRRARMRHGVSTGQPNRGGVFVPLPSTTLALAGLGIILVGLAVLAWTVWPRDPDGDSPEAGFLRDMYNHHSQAVGMSMLIRDRTEDTGLMTLTTEIALGQSTQMGTMLGYLDLWDLGLGTTDLPMTWMDHPTEGLMPGMATPREIEQLRTLPVAEAEVLFLQLMIRHHQGGVEMAEAYLARGDQDEVTYMAERIAFLQESEIRTMNAMLEERGESPITDPLPDSHNDH